MKFNIGNLIFYKESPRFWTGIIIKNDEEFVTYIIFRASNPNWLGKTKSLKKSFKDCFNKKSFIFRN